MFCNYQSLIIDLYFFCHKAIIIITILNSAEITQVSTFSTITLNIIPIALSAKRIFRIIHFIIFVFWF